MSSQATIAPRAVAEDVAEWYLSVLDRSVSHSDNVTQHLKQALLVLTRQILLDDEEDGDFVGGGGSPIGGSDALTTTGDMASDWRAYLTTIGSMDSLDNSIHGGGASYSPTSASSGGGEGGGGGPKLSRRSTARLRAFLSSCRLALPDDPFPTPGTKAGGGGGGGQAPSSPGPAPSLREAEAAKAAAAADTAARQLLGKPLHDGKDGSRSQQQQLPQALPESAKVDTDAVSLEAALSGFSVGVDRGKDNSKKKDKTSSNGKKKDSKIKRQTSTASAASSSFLPRPQQRYPQFEADDLAVRVELYIRSLRRVRETGDECVLALEPPRAVRARVRGVVDSFVVTVGCVRSIGPVLTRLVGSLTCELLAVEVIGEELKTAIGRLASEYEHQTSFASLAFLSTPEDAAGTHLTPLLMAYVQYLQSDWERLVAHCELESMLSRAIDPEIRNMFKTIEFLSIGHLLDVCHQNRSHLQNIILPKAEEEDIMKQVTDPKLLKQAMKDVRREIITVNGNVLPSAKTLKDLVRLITEALNSKPLTLSHGGKKRRKKKRSGKNKVQGAVAAANGHANVSSSEDSGMEAIISDSDLSSGCEGDMDGAGSDVDGTGKPKMSRRRSTVDVGTIEYMTRRILVAASRTGTGGDSYFVVRDLFGGEDVEVLPSSSQPTYSSSRPNMIGRTPHRGSGGTIELIVRLASVTIKCHGRYDVYPKPFVEDCEPLIQLHTTTEETVSMHEVRTNDGDKTVLTLKEKRTDTTGFRSLSIRPALYEKVEVLNTPS